jgi:adenylate kinase
LKTIVLLGPPGCGKGTQGKILAGLLGGKHISTGDVLRKNAVFQKAIADGSFVSDAIACEIVANEIHASPLGVILDGFPRTLHQAEWLHRWYRIVPIFLGVPRYTLDKRIAQRYAEEGRPDDTPEIFEKRLETFSKQTMAAIKFFEEKCFLIVPPIEGDIKTTTDIILQSLRQRGHI